MPNLEGFLICLIRQSTNPKLPKRGKQAKEEVVLSGSDDEEGFRSDISDDDLTINPEDDGDESSEVDGWDSDSDEAEDN